MTGLQYNVEKRTQSTGLRIEDVDRLKAAFAALDHLAADVDGHSDLVMEMTNVVADLLRGVVASVHGVDVRPSSELGPHEAVDLGHSLGVLTRIVAEAREIEHAANTDKEPVASVSVATRQHHDAPNCKSQSFKSLPAMSSHEIDLASRLSAVEKQVASLSARGRNGNANGQNGNNGHQMNGVARDVAGLAQANGQVWPGQFPTIEMARVEN